MSRQASELTFESLQDIIFGSEGAAQADFERMEEINTEIGLTAIVRGAGHQTADADFDDVEKEKVGNAEYV